MSTVSACQERSPQKLKRSLVIGLTDLHGVTDCSPNGVKCTLSVDFCAPTWPHLVSYCLLLQRAAQAVAGSQGHCRLVLCGGWRLHRLNWTLCNYRMPLILHCFKDWLLLTLFNTCTGFKKETIPQRSVVRFILKPSVFNNNGCDGKRVNTWDIVGLHAKFHQYQSGLYFDNILLLTLLKNKHNLSLPRLP